jgi:hypothetical protein
MTYDLVNIKLYIDGLFQTKTAYSGNIDTDVTDMVLGRTNAIVDELRIYSRALSDTEIQSLYNATNN